MTTAPTYFDSNKGLASAQPQAIDNPSRNPFGFGFVNDQLLYGDAQLLRQPAGNIWTRNVMLVALHLDNGSRRDTSECRQALYRKPAPFAPVFQLVSQIAFILHGPLQFRRIRLAGLNCKTFLKDLQRLLFLMAFVC